MSRRPRRLGGRLGISLALALPLIGSRVAAEPAPARVKVELQGDDRGCLSADAISERIVHYFTDVDASTQGFGILVRARSDGLTEFEIQRAGSLLAVRRFPVLPDACSERLNAIAIAIAMGIEQAGSPARGSTRPAARPELRVAIAPAVPGPSEAVAVDTAVEEASSADVPAPEEPDSAPLLEESSSSSEDATEEVVRLEQENVLPARVEETHVQALSGATKRDTPAPAEEHHPAKVFVEHFSMHGGAGVLIGVLPSPVIAGFAGGEVPILDGLIRIRLSAVMSGWSQDQLLTGQVDTQVWAARLASCHREAFGWVALNACGGVLFGRYTARGNNYLVDRTASLPWNAGFSHVGLRLFERSALTIEAGAEVYINMIRPSLKVEGAIDDPLHMPVFAIAPFVELVVVL